MQFCPNCDNAFVITRISQSEQQAQIQQVQQKQSRSLKTKSLSEILDSDTSDVSETEVTSASTTQHNANANANATAMGGANVKTEKKSEGYYFKCTNCGYIIPIQDDTLILRRTNEEHTEDTVATKYSDMIHDVTLPHTRNYICPNKSCKSHTEYNLRDAVWFKPDRNSYMIKYVCTTCKTVW